MKTRPHSLVIGGTRGIGREVTRLFAAAGDAVSVIGRRQPATEDRDQPRVTYWIVDLLDSEATGRAIREAIDQSGKLDHAVFLQRYRGEGDCWAGELETTLTVTKRVIESLADEFDDSGARGIVIVSSVMSQWIGENQPIGYHVAKAGLDALIRYYAVTLGPRGIRVNGVAPCTTLKEESAARGGDAATFELFAAFTPLGRMGTSADVASVVRFLSGRQASFVTGQILTVDGGASVVLQESIARKLVPSTRVGRFR